MMVAMEMAHTRGGSEVEVTQRRGRAWSGLNDKDGEAAGQVRMQR